LREKQVQIHNLLSTGTNDALQIGRLTIEVHELQKQTSIPEDQFRQRALAVLTAEQRVKLGQLENILKLTPAANQAVQLLLLAPLPPGQPVILATPGGIEPAVVP
jgi:Spy/CpxP family protein refolding chaperone